MVRKTVIVSENNITGKIDDVQAVCNLSSVPHTMLADLTATVSWLPSKLNILTLYTSMLITNEKKLTRIKGKKQYKVTFIVDEDDKHYDHKIKNITKLNNWKSQGIIVIKKIKSTKVKKNMQGLKMRICSHHHSRDAMRLLTAVPYMKRNVGSLSSVELITTYGDRVNSIAGLTYILKKHSVHYTVEVMLIDYAESWLSTHKKYGLKDIEIIEYSHENKVEEDKFWQYKTGCAEYLVTNEGKVKVKINTKKTSNNGSDATKQGIDMLKSIVDIIKKISKMFVNVINRLFQIFTPKSKKVNNDSDTRK